MHKLLLDLPDHLETERLILRPYQPGDGPMYYQAGLRNRDHLARFEPDNGLRSLQTLEEAEIQVREMAAAWQSRGYFFWAALEKSSGDFVGNIYVGPVNWDTPEFEVGYIADAGHQGKGYITEALKAVLHSIFEDFHAHRVSLHTSAENTRSQRVAERCGFVLEGCTREDHRAPDGHLENSLHYGRLKTDL